MCSSFWQNEMDDEEFDKALIMACDNVMKEKIEKTNVSKHRLPVESNALERPSIDFNFPFEPYLIQTDFMQKLFECLEKGTIGIFESPTGTGKSLSLICGSFTWLEKFKENFREEAKAAIKLAEELRQKQQESLDDWLNSHENIRIQEQLAFEMKQKLLKLDSLDDRLNKLKIGIFSKNNSLKSYKRPIIEDELNDVDTDENEQNGDNFLLDDYFSDEDSNCTIEESSSSRNIDSASSSDDFYATKLFYTARTHSQLSQFVQELKKTKFSRTARVITLTSRQTTCLNEKVKRLGHVNLINDACLHMQRQKQEKFKKCLDGTKERKSRGGCQCPYYR